MVTLFRVLRREVAEMGVALTSVGDCVWRSIDFERLDIGLEDVEGCP